MTQQSAETIVMEFTQIHDINKEPIPHFPKIGLTLDGTHLLIATMVSLKWQKEHENVGLIHLRLLIEKVIKVDSDTWSEEVRPDYRATVLSASLNLLSEQWQKGHIVVTGLKNDAKV